MAAAQQGVKLRRESRGITWLDRLLFVNVRASPITSCAHVMREEAACNDLRKRNNRHDRFSHQLETRVYRIPRALSKQQDMHHGWM